MGGRGPAERAGRVSPRTGGASAAPAHSGWAYAHFLKRAEPGEAFSCVIAPEGLWVCEALRVQLLVLRETGHRGARAHPGRRGVNGGVVHLGMVPARHPLCVHHARHSCTLRGESGGGRQCVSSCQVESVVAGQLCGLLQPTKRAPFSPHVSPCHTLASKTNEELTVHAQVWGQHSSAVQRLRPWRI